MLKINSAIFISAKECGAKAVALKGLEEQIMKLSSSHPDIHKTDNIPYIDILNEYSETLLSHFPDDLQSIILFGSQVRGNASAESDIDVLTPKEFCLIYIN